MVISQGPKESTPGPSILFAGDCILSDYFSESPVEKSVCDLIEDANISLVNFEAPIENGSPSPKHGPIHTHEEDAPAVLHETGFDVATLANNHIMDQGTEGSEKTVKYCQKEGLETVGVGSDADSAMEPFCTNIDGTDIAIFNACQKEFGIADKETPGAAWIRQPGFESLIASYADNVDIVIVVAHGGVEYVPIPPKFWQKTLRSFIDVGADAVIAHHPHIAQGWEWHGKCPIFYSLGNFSFRIESRPSSAWSYVVNLPLDGDQLTDPKIHLIETDEGQVQYMANRNPDVHWDHLLHLSEVTKDSAENDGYWQEVAVRMFHEVYTPRLDDFRNGRVVSLIKQPNRELGRLTRGVIAAEDRNQETQLNFLNLVQNESHQDVIQTALEVKTGVVEDQRTPTIISEVDDLFEWVDERPERSSTERLLSYFEKGMRRLI